MYPINLKRSSHDLSVISPFFNTQSINKSWADNYSDDNIATYDNIAALNHLVSFDIEKEPSIAEEYEGDLPGDAKILSEDLYVSFESFGKSFGCSVENSDDNESRDIILDEDESPAVSIGVVNEVLNSVSRSFNFRRV